MDDNKNFIQFNKMTNEDFLLEQLKNTYELSFPEEERRDFSLICGLIANESKFSAYALTTKGNYVGFITTWNFEDFVYIEHFAIEPIARNGGIGANVMQQFLSGKESVVLEVEVPIDELSKRRVEFYERLGFKLDSHPYFQPPYRKEGRDIEMRLMSYGCIDMEDLFNSVCYILHSNVYGVNKKG